MFESNVDAKVLVEKFYQSENDRDGVVNQSVTVRMDVAHACMLNAMSRRFNQSRTSIMKHIIEAETVKMFELLSPQDKEALAIEADEEMTAHMLQSGHSITSAGIAGHFENEWSEWRAHLRTSEYLEKKSSEGEE
jgi:hypothetical protein